jgi:hypothetical protein
MPTDARQLTRTEGFSHGRVEHHVAGHKVLI